MKTLACVIHLVLLAAPALGAITVRGVVVDEAGEPVVGAVVELAAATTVYQRGVWELAEEGSPEPQDRSRTDRTGAYSLSAPGEGMWRIVVEPPGGAPRRFGWEPLYESVDLPPLEVSPAEQVTVTVLDPEGKPVAGARVAARVAGGAGPSWAPRGWTAAPLRRSTDAAGRVRFPRGEGEELQLEVFAPGFAAPLAGDPVALEGSSTTLRLVAGEPRSLEVVDRHGRPVKGVQVRVGAAGWVADASDEEGRSSVVTRPGTDLDMVLEAADGRTLELTLEPPPKDEPEKPVRLRLPPARFLSGVVIDNETKEPVESAFVWRWGNPGAFVRSDGRGRWELAAGLSEGSIVEASAKTYQPRTARATPREEATLELPAVATVLGRVVDEAGDGIAEARIQWSVKGVRGAYSVTRASGTESTSDPDGAFRLGRVAIGSTLELKVSKQGFARTETVVRALRRAETREVEIVLDAGRGLVGYVVDEEDRPVAGAQVEAHPVDPGSGSWQALARSWNNEAEDITTATDEEGRFRLVDLAEGRFGLSVLASGYAPLEMPGVVIPEGEGDFELGTVVLIPGATIEGRVVDADRNPVEGVMVRYSGVPSYLVESAARGAGHVVTAADGGFRVVDLLPDKRVTLSLFAQGYLHKSLEGVMPPTEEPLEVVLEPASTVSGRVLDPTGVGVSGAQVALGGQGVTGFAVRPVWGRTDEEGHFELEGVGAGRSSIEVKAEGFLVEVVDGIEVPPGDAVSGLEIRLRQGARVEGRVVNQDGEPVAGASLSVGTESRMGLGGANASTDRSGEFVLEGVAPGKVTVWAHHPDYLAAMSTLTVSEQGARTELVLKGGWSISGRVVATDGGPVEGAKVSQGAASSFGFSSGSPVLTDPGGEFEITGVSDGLTTVTAEHPDTATFSEPLEVRVAGAPIAGLELTLAGGGTVVGSLLGLSFDDLAELQVVAVGENRSKFVAGDVDYEARYRVAPLPIGTWRVTAMLPSGNRQAQGRVEITVPGEEVELDLDFDKGASVAGRVTRNGEPVAGVYVTLSGISTHDSGMASTNHEGAFRIEGLPEGRYRADLFDLRTESQHREEVEVFDGAHLELELRGSRVTGQVVDRVDGAAISGASLELRSEDATLQLRGFGRDVRSDTGGRFAFGEHSPGSWRLVVEKEGYAVVSMPVELVAGVDLDGLTIELAATRGAALRVESRVGSRPTAVTVAVLGPDGVVLQSELAVLDAEGVAWLDTLPPGRWEVLVGGEGLGAERVFVEAPEGESTVVLDLEGRLEVRVPDLEGEEVAAEFSVRDSNGREFYGLAFGSYLTRPRRLVWGRTMVTGLPAGTWALEATTVDGRSWTGTATTTAGGRTEVTLD